MIFLGLSASDTPAFAKEAGIKDTVDFPAGPLGGLMRCGHKVEGTATLHMCVWIDHATMGLVLPIDAAEEDAAAAIALKFRADAEHGENQDWRRKMGTSRTELFRVAS